MAKRIAVKSTRAAKTAKAAKATKNGASATQASSITQASSVFDRLQADILTGALPPGTKLRLKELIERYETGNSPLREALNRLSAAGMVIRQENRGFMVPPASAEDLVELTRTRSWLEEIALRESIKHGDGEWEERIVVAYHWLARSARTTDEKGDSLSPEWEAHHQQFHAALISACRSTILMEFCEELAQRSFRYRSLAEVVEYRDRHELDEHRALHDATIARDADTAVKLLRQHYEVTSNILLESGRFD